MDRQIIKPEGKAKLPGLLITAEFYWTWESFEEQQLKTMDRCFGPEVIPVSKANAEVANKGMLLLKQRFGFLRGKLR